MRHAWLRSSVERTDELSSAPDQAPPFWLERAPNCRSVLIEHRKGHSAAGHPPGWTLASTRGVALNDFAGVSRCVARAGRMVGGRSRPLGGWRRRSFRRPWLCGIGAEVGPVLWEGGRNIFVKSGRMLLGRETRFGECGAVCCGWLFASRILLLKLTPSTPPRRLILS